MLTQDGKLGIKNKEVGAAGSAKGFESARLPALDSYVPFAALCQRNSTGGIDPYAQVATMRRSGLGRRDFSYEDGLQGPASSSHSFGRHERSRCAAPASVDLASGSPGEIIGRLRVNAEQSGSPANAGVVASRSQSSAPQVRRLLSRVATGRGDCHCIAGPQCANTMSRSD